MLKVNTQVVNQVCCGGRMVPRKWDKEISYPVWQRKIVWGKLVDSTSPLSQPFFNAENVFSPKGKKKIKSNSISYIEIGASICLPLSLSLIFKFCYCLLFLVSSPILSLSLLREVSWHRQDADVGGEQRWEELPRPVSLGWSTSQEDMILLPAGGSQGGCPSPQQDHRNMLSTTMVGTLVRGWRNRSSPRRAELKPAAPQRQGGIRIHGMWLTLWCDWVTFYEGIQGDRHKLTGLQVTALQSGFFFFFLAYINFG